MPAAPSIFNDGAERDFDTLGSRLSRARQSAGLTAAGLARSTGVRKATLDNWERDRAEPRANLVFRLAGILGVSPAWLLVGLGEPPENATQAEDLLKLSSQLAQLRECRDQANAIIETMDRTIAHLINQVHERDGDRKPS